MNRLKLPALSGSNLKWIAIWTMAIDHLAYGVLFAYLNQVSANGLTNASGIFARLGSMGISPVLTYQTLGVIYHIGRYIGRIAFPIFCFLMVEGFQHTKHLGRYVRNIAIFAFLSEIPFDFGLRAKWIDPAHQNVFWTLLIGMFCLICIKKAEERFYYNRSLLILSQVVIVVVGAMLAQVCHTDYGGFGVCVICILYIRREMRVGAPLLATLILVIMGKTEITAPLAVPLICQYDGTRGKQNKYFFYIFYPAHLLVIGAIRTLIFLL